MYEGTLAAEAGQLENQGALMRSYLAGGTLPPGQEASLTAASEGATASVASEYAAHGMSGSSAEAQDLQNVQQQKLAAQGQLATQLFSQGVSETEMSANIYTNLMQTQLNQDAELQQAFGNFAAALAGMGRPVAANG
jgi:hypothetical protein